jgi:UDP-N-acetylglucosamine acyltransferase
MEAEQSIHPTAIVDRRADLGESVKIGPYVVIEGRVKIGAGTIIKAHSIIGRDTIVGRNCKIGPAAYVGMDPQHMRYVPREDAPTYLVVGDNVTIREGSRIGRATVPGVDHATKIGDDCFIMGAVHIAHDCVLEPHVIMADGALLGGHCHIGQWAFLGGGCTVHQFVHIGRLAIIAGNEQLSHDVPPFGAVRYGRLKGYNAIGCKRAGMDRTTIWAIRRCFQALRQNRTVPAALADIRANVQNPPEVIEFVEFIASAKRGIPQSRVRTASGSQSDSASDVGGAEAL